MSDSKIPMNNHDLNHTEHSLYNLAPLDSRYRTQVDVLRPYLSEFALIKYRVQVEVEWLIALSLAKLPQIIELSGAHIDYLRHLVKQFCIDDALRIKHIEKTTNHDVKSVEYWLKESIGLPIAQHVKNLSTRSLTMPAHLAQDFMTIAEFIHFACTSEDINNMAYGLMLQHARQVMLNNVQQIKDSLKMMSHTYADISMLSRTHGQTASPTTLGKEIANVLSRLQKATQTIEQVTLLGKMNGAVGNFNAHLITYPNFDWQDFSKQLIENLGLTYNPYTIQIEPHDYMAELFEAFARLNTILIDFSRDVWGYISLGYFKQRTIAGEVGSSTMPHKVNPIDFENAEGNFGVANALLYHFSQKLPISRWQRDLTDSTVLRTIGMAFGHTLLAYKALMRGLSKLEINQSAIDKDLNQSWEVLAEAIQTVMRRYGVDNPYEQLKTLTRGQAGINAEVLSHFIETLAIPLDEKQRLKQLTPHSYIGYASVLAKQI